MAPPVKAPKACPELRPERDEGRSRRASKHQSISLSAANRPHVEGVGLKADAGPEADDQVHVPGVGRVVRDRSTRPVEVRLDAGEWVPTGQSRILTAIVNQALQLPHIRQPPVASAGTIAKAALTAVQGVGI